MPSQRTVSKTTATHQQHAYCCRCPLRKIEHDLLPWFIQRTSDGLPRRVGRGTLPVGRGMRGPVSSSEPPLAPGPYVQQIPAATDSAAVPPTGAPPDGAPRDGNASAAHDADGELYAKDQRRRRQIRSATRKTDREQQPLRCLFCREPLQNAH